MAENEDKGFIIKDREPFSQAEESGEPGGEAGAEKEQPKSAAEAAREYKEKSEARQEARTLPQVSFSTFIFSLSSSALVHLAEIPDPNSQERQLDLAMAKQIIDTLGMLQEKTRGNLEPDEDRMLQSVLYDLRMRYVQKLSG